MKVILKNDWFINETIYRRSSLPITIPDSLRDVLPSSAKIIDKPVDKPEESKKIHKLSDFDIENAASVSEGKIHDRVNEKLSKEQKN